MPDGDDDYDDDDDYVEFIFVANPLAASRTGLEEKSDTAAGAGRTPAAGTGPARATRSGPGASLLDRPVPQARPIGFAHNGSQWLDTDTGRRLASDHRGVAAGFPAQLIARPALG